jgi:hypothetical protein
MELVLSKELKENLCEWDSDDDMRAELSVHSLLFFFVLHR